MCGIFAVVGGDDIVNRILDGLAKLEYRGYDSAGIAVTAASGLQRWRVAGRVAQLARVVEREPVAASAGIGHTRWATHGEPTASNAHPHMTPRVAAVHNGIIENHHELRRVLTEQGCAVDTPTDTEVVPWLVDLGLRRGLSPREAVRETTAVLRGSFALAFLFTGYPDLVIAAKRGSPLVVGFSDGALFVSSDPLAFAGPGRLAMPLEDGDIAVVSTTGVDVMDGAAQPVRRTTVPASIRPPATDRGAYPHFMLKEIHEQAEVATGILQAYGDGNYLASLPIDFSRLGRLAIIACGTSYYAGLMAKHWLESLAALPVEVEVASEFRYRRNPKLAGDAVLLISQSGETADTLACLEMARRNGMTTLALLNVTESSMGRAADGILPLLAGPEIGVASTKAFTAQLLVLAHLAVHAAVQRRAAMVTEIEAVRIALAALPDAIGQTLAAAEGCAKAAARIAPASSALFIGRGASHVVALEGALKLKEIAYVHAQAYAAGELKHGPIALVDAETPVIAVAPCEPLLFEKMASNLEEVAARRGPILLVSDPDGVRAMRCIIKDAIAVPATDPFLTPFLSAVVMQLLAYHVAVLRGTDVDRPRNLAKSVTVE